MRIAHPVGPWPRAIMLAATCSGLAILAACGSSSKASPGASPTSATTSTSTRASSPVDAATTTYVANVCEAVKQLDASISLQRGSRTNTSGSPSAAATASPSVDAAARAKALQDAGTAFVTAILAANPPAPLQAYNAQLADAVNTAITRLASGTPFAGGGFAGGPNGTPRARPSGTPRRTPASGTRPAGGRGGAAAIFLRNLPPVPAASASALKQAASQDSNCQASGFAFGQ